MDKKQDVFFGILRRFVCGQEVGLPDGSETDAGELYDFAARQDMAHLVSLISFSSADGETRKKIGHARDTALYRSVRQEHFGLQLFSALTQSGIPFIPLKGLVLRKLYPEPWMRTSCDLDILINNEDVPRASQLMRSMGYSQDGERGYHDVSFLNGDIHVELHFNICETLPKPDRILAQAWEYAEPVDGMEYRLAEPFFLFYHIAHLCYHFISGGCGIRPFLDLYLLTHRPDFEETALLPLLSEGGLLIFYEKCSALCRVWFEGAEHDSITRPMEDAIFRGGLYGSTDGSGGPLAAARQKNRFVHAFRIIFPPFRSMCFRYPALEKHPYLLPFSYGKRILYKLKTRRRAVTSRMRAVLSQNREEVREAEKLLTALGIDF